MKFKISRHAKEEMRLRQIPLRIVREVLANPGQSLIQVAGTKIYQSKITFEAVKFIWFECLWMRALCRRW